MIRPDVELQITLDVLGDVLDVWSAARHELLTRVAELMPQNSPENLEVFCEVTALVSSHDTLKLCSETLLGALYEAGVVEPGEF